MNVKISSGSVTQSHNLWEKDQRFNKNILKWTILKHNFLLYTMHELQWFTAHSAFWKCSFLYYEKDIIRGHFNCATCNLWSFDIFCFVWLSWKSDSVITNTLQNLKQEPAVLCLWKSKKVSWNAKEAIILIIILNLK